MKPNGYRYVRAYWLWSKGRTLPRLRWALWEVQDGRKHRVGTASNEDEYKAFLGLLVQA